MPLPSYRTSPMLRHPWLSMGRAFFFHASSGKLVPSKRMLLLLDFERRHLCLRQRSCEWGMERQRYNNNAGTVSLR